MSGGVLQHPAVFLWARRCEVPTARLFYYTPPPEICQAKFGCHVAQK
jgi:hypothetical protein